MRHRRLRALGLLLSLSLVLSAAACGDDDSETTTGGNGDSGGDKPRVGLVYDVGGRDDKSFNDSAYTGLKRAEDELDVEVKDLEPDAGGENREQLLADMADEGYELIIGVGFAFGESMGKVAADYPDTEFAIVDSVVEADNVTSLTFAEQEGSFLIGAIAALKSETGIIGFVGGVESELIRKFEAGYVAGAEAAKPDIEVQVKYLTPDGDFSGFRDPAKGKTVAQGLYDGGADVVYHAAGGSGTGVFEAAVEKGGLAIGVDSDQYLTAPPEQQEVIITSMLKRVDVSVYDTIKAFIEGDLEGGVQTFDLKSGGIDYSTSGGQVDDVKDQVDEFKQQIIDGEITVPTEP